MYNIILKGLEGVQLIFLLLNCSNDIIFRENAINNTLRNKMKFLELKNELKDFAIFSLNEIRTIDPNFHRRRLNEWQDKSYIKKVIRGYYIFSDLQLSEEILFKIAFSMLAIFKYCPL
ncbi:unnamed protein product [marine sediment metagenome]|uniref:AbiEi antitoxin C-terminal domain-containing protein n=1 Tax=marine sediment metagenome TaxID=412755 RepID=X1NAL7_9ZZZZ